MKKLFSVLLAVSLVLLSFTCAAASDFDNPAKIEGYINIATLVIAAASAAANAFPDRRASAAVDILGRLVDFLALNWRKKNRRA